MPNRPIERINFVVERRTASLQIKAFLYEGDDIVASTGRTVLLDAEQRDYVRLAELMDALGYLTSRCIALKDQPPLPL
jgi:hypothetical protein